jgi:hypothetical protein
MKPTIGRIVHYVSYGTPGGEYGRECRAAIVTEVNMDRHSSSAGRLDPRVGLCVLNPSGQFFSTGVAADHGTPDAESRTTLCGGLDYRGGTWHWPEMVREPGDRPPRT